MHSSAEHRHTNAQPQSDRQRAITVRNMGDFVHGRESVLLGRLDSDVTDDLHLDAAPTTVRRKSSVRFLTELTISINSTGDPPLINSSRGQSNHHRALVSTKQMIPDRETSNERGAQFHRWRTDRKEREARMEQNIKWLKEEIVSIQKNELFMFLSITRNILKEQFQWIKATLLAYAIWENCNRHKDKGK